MQSRRRSTRNAQKDKPVYAATTRNAPNTDTQDLIPDDSEMRLSILQPEVGIDAQEEAETMECPDSVHGNAKAAVSIDSEERVNENDEKVIQEFNDSTASTLSASATSNKTAKAVEFTGPSNHQRVSDPSPNQATLVTREEEEEEDTDRIICTINLERVQKKPRHRWTRRQEEYQEQKTKARVSSTVYVNPHKRKLNHEYGPMNHPSCGSGQYPPRSFTQSSDDVRSGRHHQDQQDRHHRRKRNIGERIIRSPSSVISFDTPFFQDSFQVRVVHVSI